VAAPSPTRALKVVGQSDTQQKLRLLLSTRIER
jgi:hypothetical protein